MPDDHAERLTRLEQELDTLLARQSERRLSRMEQGLDKLSTIMLELAATTDKLEDQFLRFIASQEETNARLQVTLEAIKELLRERRN